MLANIKPLCVAPTVNPVVAIPTQCNQVGQLKSKFDIPSPRLDVVRMNRLRRGFRCPASAASVSIASVHGSHDLLPLGTGVRSLSLWTAAVDVPRVFCPIPAIHAVSLAAKIRLWLRCADAKFSTRFRRVRLALKWVLSRVHLHKVIGAGKVHSARPSRYSEILQLLVDALRIAANDLAYVVSRKTFDDVFLTKPIGI